VRASTDRILTTHVGSLPRSAELLKLLVSVENGDEVDRDHLRAVLERDLRTVARSQMDVGIDIACDGELPRIGFSNYVKDRMSGFGGVGNRNGISDLDAFPGYAALKARTSTNPEQLKRTASIYTLPEAQAKVTYDPDLTAAKEELDLFERALDGTGAAFAETFITAASPGIISTTLLRAADNPEYATDGDYLRDLAAEMRPEYEYIVSRGHVLQVDAPDLAFEYQCMFRGRPMDEFLDRMRSHVEALNEAIAGIDPNRVRMHVCWGNWDGPHVEDVELESIIELLYEARVGALVMPVANPRHQADYKVLRRYPLPEGMVIMPGVIDVTYNYVEHPEVVADRLCQIAEVVGDPTRVIACTDCGFGTFAGLDLVAEDVAWRKLRVLAEGAEIASRRLFGS
jgi:5-methyltetrahydropteroyltriglutamate--homocysteine methyltransferase